MIPAHADARAAVAVLGALFALAFLAAPDAAAQRRSGARTVVLPYAAILHSSDTIYWLNVAPLEIPLAMGPREALMAVSGSELVAVDDSTGRYTAVVQRPQEGIVIVTARASYGDFVASDEKVVVVDRPRLRHEKMKEGMVIATGIDEWRGMVARIGEIYDPSSEFNTPNIPENHYQTIVTIRGTELLNRPGTTFRPAIQSLDHPLRIRAGMKAEDIVTKVFWKPGGTSDITKWVLMVCNQSNCGAVFPLERKSMAVEPATQPPPADLPNAMVLTFTPDVKRSASPPLDLAWMLKPGDTAAVAGVVCPDCATYRLDARLLPLPAGRWRLEVTAENYGLLENRRAELESRSVELKLSMQGRDEPQFFPMRLYVALLPLPGR